MRGTRSGSAIALANPLPAALHHYERELRDVLEAGGSEVHDQACPDVEVAGHGRGLKLRRAIGSLTGRVGGSGSEPTVALWPVFGLADPATWVLHRGRIWVIVHDPEPLRAQAGMSRVAATLGRMASRRHIGVIVHTELAGAVLEDAGWDPIHLPHPICRPEPLAPGSGDQLVVLGQWKPARSMEPLNRLARVPQWDGRRQVVGRGWPEVEGWSVDSRFVSEREVDLWIDRAASVVLPYARYFQSNISVRALERLRPVVGQGHEFLSGLFGTDWPGIVVDDDWAGAVEAVHRVTVAEMDARRKAYWDRCVEEWGRFVAAAR